MKMPPLNVALLGTGNIGSDLLFKLERSSGLSCTLVAGRNLRSEGMRRAAERGYRVSDGGIQALMDAPERFDLVFDATNAMSHRLHWDALEALGKRVVDLTPSKIGHMVVPAVNGHEALDHRNISLVTCGGQAMIPIVQAIAGRVEGIRYAEIVTTAASPGVGRATRLNLDEYIHATEAAVRAFTEISSVKTMLNISVAQPPADFRVTLSLLVPNTDLAQIEALVRDAVARVRRYVPGYRLVACSKLDPQRVMITVLVRGGGDLLPAYAGNLDIINSAAVAVAERWANSDRRPSKG